MYALKLSKFRSRILTKTTCFLSEDANEKSQELSRFFISAKLGAGRVKIKNLAQVRAKNFTFFFAHQAELVEVFDNF